ncbi:iron transporter [Cellvibrio japonicus Ueda107]|uniref:Iron transporter n=1 Tax=Cellvibrio japonicus (strain Ueda107) TaxID=498211 RepID=B3PC59_CELJU|nr:iron transporter [Cellvibrio japonicus Ueda107]
MNVPVYSFPLFHLLLGAGLLLPSLAWASSGQVLETLVVTAKPTVPSALSVNLVTRSTQDLLPGPGAEVADWLQGLPGVQVDNRTNLAQDARISLRGFGARSAFGVRGVDLLLDGVPMSQADGQGQLSSVMLDQVAYVDVIRGPLAGLYGSGAGGVIALSSAIPTQHRARIGLSGGQEGLRRQSLNLEGNIDGLAASLGVAAMEQLGARPHAYAERQQWNAQVFYTLTDTLQINLKHAHTQDPLLQDPLGLTPEQWQNDPYQANPLAEQFNTHKRVDHRQTSVSLRQEQDDWRWQAAAWTGVRDITQYLGFSGAALNSSGGVVDLARDFGGASINLGRDFLFWHRPLNITLGADWAYMDDRRRGYVNNQGIAGDLRRDESGEVESSDAFAVLQWQWNSALDVYAGLRRSRVDFSVKDYFINVNNPDDSGARDYRDQSYAMGGRYQSGKNWSFFFSAGGGFETPTLTEMAYRNEGPGLNIALDAARIRQQEAGVRVGNTVGELTLTAFAIDTQDELVVDQSIGGRTSYRNAAGTQREGVELSGHWNLNSHWRMQINAQVMDAYYSRAELVGHQLPGVAAEQYQWDIHYHPLANRQLIFSLGLHKRSRIASSDSNTSFAPGFYRIDMGVEGYRALADNSLHWWLKLANASDENYVGSVIVNQSNSRAFEPAQGRSLMVGVNLWFE